MALATLSTTKHSVCALCFNKPAIEKGVRVPVHLLAYTLHGRFTKSSFKAFTDVTARGQWPWVAVADLSEHDKLLAKDLMDAHSKYSKVPSPLVEGLWIDGLRDFPPRIMLRYHLMDAVRNGKEWWDRKLPLWERLYSFSRQYHVNDPL